jgi:molybdopterin molybdotransferase
MPDIPRTEISVEEARKFVLSQVRPMGLETVFLLDARERVLGEDLVAPRNLPPWDNSAMDGYAVLHADLKTGARLQVIEDVPAGYEPKKTVTAGTAIRIMTGAPIPKGADVVLPVELTSESGETVTVTATGKLPSPREHIRPSGEDVKAGETVIRAGEVMSPAAIGVAASLGRATVRVFQRPRVAILSTGDEIAEVGGPVGGGQIYTSNSYTLAAACARIGAVPVYLGIARDTREDLHAKLSAALGCDAILTTGGVSVGEYDFVKEVLQSLGSKMQFWRVAQRPGYPLAFGLIGERPAFGLPGNPVSTMVSFEQYAQPALLKMAGRTRLFAPMVQARLEDEIRVKPGKTYFLRGVLRREGDGFVVRTTGGQGSGILSSMLRGNSLIVIPVEKDGAKPGEVVQVQVIDPNFWLSESAGF